MDNPHVVPPLRLATRKRPLSEKIDYSDMMLTGETENIKKGRGGKARAKSGGGSRGGGGAGLGAGHARGEPDSATDCSLHLGRNLKGLLRYCSNI